MTLMLPRRERLRQATQEEIKSTAWAQMTADGTAALSLRAAVTGRR